MPSSGNPLAGVNTERDGDDGIAERTTVTLQVRAASPAGSPVAAPANTKETRGATELASLPASREGGVRSFSTSFVRPMSQQVPARLIPPSRESIIVDAAARATSASQRSGLSSRMSTLQATMRAPIGGASSLNAASAMVDLRRDTPMYSTKSLSRRICCCPFVAVAYSLCVVIATTAMLSTSTVNQGRQVDVMLPDTVACAADKICMPLQYAPTVQRRSQLEQRQAADELDDIAVTAMSACSVIATGQTTCSAVMDFGSARQSALYGATFINIVSPSLNCTISASSFAAGAIALRFSDAATSCIVQVAVAGSSAAMGVLQSGGAAVGASITVVATRLRSISGVSPVPPSYVDADAEHAQSTLTNVNFWPQPVLEGAAWPAGVTQRDVLVAVGFCALATIFAVSLLCGWCTVVQAGRFMNRSLEDFEATAAAAFDRPPVVEDPIWTNLGASAMGPNSRGELFATPGARSLLTTPSGADAPRRQLASSSMSVPQSPEQQEKQPVEVTRKSSIPALTPAQLCAVMPFAEAVAAAAAMQLACKAIEGVASYVPMALSYASPEGTWGGGGPIDFFANPGGNFQSVDVERDKTASLVVFDLNQTAEAAAVRSGASTPHGSFKNSMMGHQVDSVEPRFRREETLARVPTPQGDLDTAGDLDGSSSDEAEPVHFSPLLKSTRSVKSPLSSSTQQRRSPRMDSSPSFESNDAKASPTLGTLASPRPQAGAAAQQSFLGFSGIVGSSSFAAINRRASALNFAELVAPYEPKGTAELNVSPITHALRQKLCTVLHCQLHVPSFRCGLNVPNAFMTGIVHKVSHEFHETAMKVAALFNGIVVSVGVDYVSFCWNGFAPYQFHEARACECALYIEQSLRSVAEAADSSPEAGQHWRISAATTSMCVATGQAVVGAVSVSNTLYPILCGENVTLARQGAMLAPLLRATTLVMEDTYAVARAHVGAIPRDTIGNALTRTVVFELKGNGVGPRPDMQTYIGAFSLLKQGQFVEAAAALRELIAATGDLVEPAYVYALRVAEFALENPSEVQILNQVAGVPTVGRGTLFRRFPTWLIQERDIVDLDEASSDDGLCRTPTEPANQSDTGRSSNEAPSTEPRVSRPAQQSDLLVASPGLHDAVARGLRQRVRTDGAAPSFIVNVEDTTNGGTVSDLGNTIEIDGESWTKSDRILGTGANGVVRVGLSSDGALSALKFIPLASLGSDASRALGEVAILSNLRHPNIVGYIGSTVAGDELVVVLEYCGGGTLANIIGLFGALPMSMLQRYARDILKGLNFLHKHGVTHRDLSLGNILVTIDGECKLSDFGASVTRSTHKPMAMGNVLGTPAFMAPETCLGQVSMMSDVWSFGIALCWMTSGHAPYDEKLLLETPVDFLRRLASDPEFGPLIPPEVRSRPLLCGLVEACLNRSVVDRPWAETLLAHPFFLS